MNVISDEEEINNDISEEELNDLLALFTAFLNLIKMVQQTSCMSQIPALKNIVDSNITSCLLLNERNGLM